jgi:2-methylisocitrate lyase-like PEP mutase family enzyme
MVGLTKRAGREFHLGRPDPRPQEKTREIPMPGHAEKSARFKQLHGGPAPLLLANAWDAGSARILASLGFQALATTSSGQAAGRGQLDYAPGRDDVLANAAEIVAATTLPVSADLEDCFAPDADGVAETIMLARQAGLAGCSIEDYSA